ncbi:hypothetical protein G7046_g1902 [Stylonectria norvegica]|nr:hypothetical protein G7046_g1902 [Stylonectria norvegica]
MIIDGLDALDERIQPSPSPKAAAQRDSSGSHTQAETAGAAPQRASGIVHPCLIVSSARFASDHVKSWQRKAGSVSSSVGEAHDLNRGPQTYSNVVADLRVVIASLLLYPHRQGPSAAARLRVHVSQAISAIFHALVHGTPKIRQHPNIPRVLRPATCALISRMDPVTRGASDVDEMVATLRRLHTEDPSARHNVTYMGNLRDRRRPSTASSPAQSPLYESPQLSPHSMAPWPLMEEEFKGGFVHAERPDPIQRPMSNDSMTSARKWSRSSDRRSSNLSYVPRHSPGPAPSKPLPSLPKSSKTTSQGSISTTSLRTNRLSESSGAASKSDFASIRGSLRKASQPDLYSEPITTVAEHSTVQPVTLTFWKLLKSTEKKPSTVYYLDISFTSSTLASKHGNNLIKFWSIASGEVQSVVKFSAYTEAHSRSRDYLIRSHAILSESSSLVAISTRFGRTIDIWNWTDKKRVQRIENADRWASNRFEYYESGWSPLAVYNGEKGLIDLYIASRDKSPFAKVRTIDLRKADLPFLPQYPLLALSNTSPLLVLAVGPRPPRAAHPPPERETLMAAWEINDNGNVSSEPYLVAKPWQYRELDTAIPCDLVTYGSIIVSIWIPASWRVISRPDSQGIPEWKLSPIVVPNRYVLSWDLSTNSTKMYEIPNTMACISPDCRYVAYCDASNASIGARGSLAILDATTGKQIFCWPDPEATASDSGPKAGFEQFRDLGRVTELAFSADGRFLVVGDTLGCCGVYEVRDQGWERR